MTSNILNAKEYLYLETFSYTFVLIIFIIFNFFYKKQEAIESFKHLKNINIKDIIYMLLTSVFFIYTSLMIYEYEHNNTAFVNGVFLRGGTLIGVLLVGIFFYQEKYSWKQIVGILLTLIGIYLLMCK
jgi:drug/metabolite transporter (DMT)-like permease